MASQAVMKKYLTSVAKNNEDYKNNKTMQDLAIGIANFRDLAKEEQAELNATIVLAYEKLQSKGVLETKSTPKSATTPKAKKSDDGGLKGILADLKKKLGAERFKDATTGTDIRKDIEIPALKKGKRVVTTKGKTTNQYGTFKNQVGRPYWENRANRYDANQPSKTRKYKLADGGEVGEEIIRDKNKNDWKSKLDFYLKYNTTPINKGSLMQLAYESNRNIDTAIPREIWGELDNTFFYVYDYNEKSFGELVDLRDKLKFSNKKVAVTIVVNDEVIRNEELPEELQNATFHQALNYVFNHDEIQAFDIRPKSNQFAKGGTIKNVEWVVNFIGDEGDAKGDYVTKYVQAKSEDEAINKGFMEISDDGEESDNYQLHSVYKLSKVKKHAQGGEVGQKFYEGQSIILTEITSPSLRKALPNYNNYVNKELVIEEIIFDIPHKRVKAFVKNTREKVPFDIFLNKGNVKKFAKGGEVSDIDYNEILPILKEKLEDAVEILLPNEFENSSEYEGEEVENKSRDGFIAFTDGGYEVTWFEYVSYFNGSGYSLPTKALDDELQRQVDQNYEYAKERFMEEYPAIYEELGFDVDYNKLYEAGYESEAEQLSEWESDYDGEGTIACQVGAYYYSPDNSRGIEGKHTIRVFGLVNLESPYHRSGNLEDRIDIDITFDSIAEMEEKLDYEISEICSGWFGGASYNESTKELRIVRMAKGGEIKKSLAEFKKKIGAKKFKEITKGVDIKADLKHDALKQGRRIVRKKGKTSNQYGTFKNKIGKVYTENRPNHYDANQPSERRKIKLADGGNVDKYNPEKTLSLVKVKFSNPKFNYTTNLSGDISEQEAKKYFVGQKFDVGVYPKENMQQVIDIDFYPKGTWSFDKEYAKGGQTSQKKDWEVVGTTMQGQKFKKIVTLGRLSTESDVRQALKKMQNDKFQVQKVTTIKEMKTYAKGGEVIAKYRLTPFKERMQNMVQSVGENQVVLEGTYNEAVIQAEVLLNSNNDFIFVEITKLGKNVLSAKKVAKVSTNGVVKYGQGGKVSNIDDEIATQELKEEVKSKMKKGDAVIHFAFTDYGGDFIDKVAIEYFEENYPKNIVVENTAYFGKNAFVFGKPAEEWIEASEDYILGFEDFESFYYEKTNEAEQEGFEDYLGELEREEYEFDGGEVLSWLMENKGGYYNVTTQGLDFSSSDITDELLEEGLIRKDEYAKGGKLSSKAKYIPKRDIAEIEVEKNGKSKFIDGDNLLDGVYVRKGTKFAKGGDVKTPIKIKKQLESIRKSIQNENVSYAELAELQSLSKYIDPNDIELREWAGIPEFEDGEEFAKGGAISTNSKEVREAIKKHILENVLDENENEFKNIDEASQYVADEFKRVADYPYNLQKYPNNQKRFTDYLQGIPFGFYFYNDDIENFLNGLGINPSGKKYSSDKMWDLYGALIWKQVSPKYNKYAKGGGVDKSVSSVSVTYFPSKAEIVAFENYVYDVYSEDGFTKKQVKEAVAKYLDSLEPTPTKQFSWGYGDSLDRERVYQFLLDPKLNKIKNPTFAKGGTTRRIKRKNA